MSLPAPLTKPAIAPVARRWLTGAALYAQIRDDIAELFAAYGAVLYGDLIRLGYSREQIKAFRGVP